MKTLLVLTLDVVPPIFIFELKIGKPGSPKRAGPGAPPKPASLTLKKPPKMALEGNKWIVVCYCSTHRFYG